MSELRRVTLPSSRTDRYVGRLIVVVAVGILIAVAKPWGADQAAPEVAAAPVATATPTPSPSPSAGPRTYDFLAWGTNEPPPGWELWPAGTLSSFSFAMRIEVAPRPAGPPASGAAFGIPTAGPSSSAPGASNASDASDAPAATTAPVPPIPDRWPLVDIPAGSSLELVAVNHPTEYGVEIVGLSSIAADGSEAPLHAITAGSPWPAHFTIVGLGASDGSGTMAPWPPGRYRLDIRISPGDVGRSIEILVEAAPVRPAAPSSVP